MVQDLSKTDEFNIINYYNQILSLDENLAVPIAAVQSLTECMARSSACTMQELIGILYKAIDQLKQGTSNLISLTAGCELFLRFLTTQFSPNGTMSFEDHKNLLVQHTLKFVNESRSSLTIMIHGYSRVVLHAILRAFSPDQNPRKRFQVYVTESRPSGLGLRTHAILTQYWYLLCLQVAYAMGKVDLVMVGAEAVLEDGGLINYIGSYQMAIAAKAHNKPFYALTESYKFLRLFPLSQYDVPTTHPTLQFPQINQEDHHHHHHGHGHGQVDKIQMPNSRLSKRSLRIIRSLDYTTPDLITLVISDSGILTPPGVAEYLLSVFGGE
ncbi:hypothetical protein DFH28DRAFT_1080583 [Melampsora americana]|nr:hypothetical protein DFH28DRAFT_1080583 [Melampsora americana]